MSVHVYVCVLNLKCVNVKLKTDKPTTVNSRNSDGYASPVDTRCKRLQLKLFLSGIFILMASCWKCSLTHLHYSTRSISCIISISILNYTIIIISFNTHQYRVTNNDFKIKSTVLNQSISSYMYTCMFYT